MMSHIKSQREVFTVVTKGVIAVSHKGNRKKRIIKQCQKKEGMLTEMPANYPKGSLFNLVQFWKTC